MWWHQSQMLPKSLLEVLRHVLWIWKFRGHGWTRTSVESRWRGSREQKPGCSTLTIIWKGGCSQVNFVIFSKPVPLSSVLITIYFSFKPTSWGSSAFAFVKGMPQDIGLNCFVFCPTGWSWTPKCLVWLEVTRPSSFIPQNTLPRIKDVGSDLSSTTSSL